MNLPESIAHADALRAAALAKLAELRLSLTIPVYFRNVWGTERIYAATPAQRDNLCALTGSVTLSRAHVEALTALGFTFAQVKDPASPSLASDLFALGVSAMQGPAEDGPAYHLPTRHNPQA